MNLTTWMVLSGVVVVAGRWSRGKGVDAGGIVGLFLLALMLTILSSVDEDFANGMAILVLIAVSYEYLPDILKSVRGVTG